MKVLHILHTLLPSGAEVMLATSSKEWVGCEKWILGTDPEIGSFAPDLEQAGYHIKHIHESSIWKQYRAVYRFIKEEGFDVVHCHRESQSAYYAILAQMAGVKRRIHTVHSVFTFTGILRIRRIFTRWLLRATGVRQVAICKDVAENEKKRFHNPCYTTVYNWCNSEIYHYVAEEEKQKLRRELQMDTKEFSIITVGNCHEIKNHDLLFYALAACKDSMNYHYYHIGSGDLEENEKALAAQLGIDKKVTFLGRRNPEAYIKASDLYVMTSLHEGFSIAALEAIHTGMHTVLTDVPGLGALADFHFENVRFCALDQKDLTDKIEKEYQRFQTEIYQNSEAQSKEAVELFGMHTGVTQYLKVYQE